MGGILAPKYLRINNYFCMDFRVLNFYIVFFNRSKKFGRRKNLNFSTMNKTTMKMKIIRTKVCLFVCLFVCLLTQQSNGQLRSIRT